MEEVEIFVNYCNNSDGITVLDGSNPKIIEDYFVKENGVFIPFEKPDFYIEIDKKVLLVEHFSFDSAQRVKKAGSLLKMEEAQKEKQFNDFVNEQHTKGVMNVEHKTTFETETSFDDYERNLIDSLIKHSNVQSYVDNFKSAVSSNKDIEFAICIENTSILPDMAYKGLDKIVILPIHSKAFLEEIRKYERIKHVFLLQSGNMGKKYVYYFQNSPNQIDKLLNGRLIDDSFKFVSWNPHSFAFSSMIPKE